MAGLDRLVRAFEQKMDIDYASMSHAALTGLVAGGLQALATEQPIIRQVGHADAAGIPVVFNTPPEKFLILVVPLED